MSTKDTKHFPTFYLQISTVFWLILIGMKQKENPKWPIFKKKLSFSEPPILNSFFENFRDFGSNQAKNLLTINCKGNLISKGNFGVIKSTKKSTEFLYGFLP